MEDKLIELIFSEQVLKDNPPVLLDLGGSGGIHEAFRKIEKYAKIICIDGDDRDFKVQESKNIIPIKTIVTEFANGTCDFYLTSSPHCSSTLEPLNSSLTDYSFSDLFNVTNKIKVNSTTLTEVLSINNISVVDWFKTDTQGTDLRLFKSLPENVREKVIVAEFEPGIIDAYKGEDKFFEVLAYMSNKCFWVDDAKIKGSIRMNLAFLAKHVPENKLKMYLTVNKESPGWCEVSFINSFEQPEMRSKRNLLLGIVFSVLKKQPGFALKLAFEGNVIYNEKIFGDIASLIMEQFNKDLAIARRRKLLIKLKVLIKKILS